MRKSKVVFGSLFVCTVLLGGCQSFKPIKTKSEVRRIMLDYQGAAGKMKELPDWVSVIIETGSDIEIQKLSKYKNLYCFAAEDSGPSKDFVLSWSKVESLAKVGTTISARISQLAKAERNGASGDEDTERSILGEFTHNIESTFSGVRPTASYWVQWRQYDPDHKKIVLSEFYTAYVLLTVEKKSFDAQVATALQRSIDVQKEVSKEERQMYTNLIKRIMEKGLDIDPVTSAVDPANSQT